MCPQASHTHGDTHSCPGIPSLLIPALPATGPEPQQTSLPCPQTPSVHAPHCPQQVRTLGRAFSHSECPRPLSSRPRWRFERPPHNCPLCSPRHPPRVNLHTGGTPATRCPPITSGARQRGCPASTQYQLPRPSHRCHRQSLASLPQKSPVCNQEGPPQAGRVRPPPTEPGHAVPRPQAGVRAPEASLHTNHTGGDRA